ncbi:MAG: hypothetical protein OXC13_09160 [Caldilineaceae bacterium]|nr:hypothetical protein [Caldilineaceae bacterium]
MKFFLGFLVACLALASCIAVPKEHSEPEFLPELRVVELDPDFWVLDAMGSLALGRRDSAVWLLDIDTGEMSQLSSRGLDLLGAALTTDYAAWIVSRKQSGAPRSVADVMLFDLQTGEQRSLTEGLAERQDLQLEYPYLAWRENRHWQEEQDDSWDIVLYHLPSGEVRPLTTIPADRQHLQLSGTRLVWQEDRVEPPGQSDTSWDVHAYDLLNDHEFPVTSAPGVQRTPLTFGDWIVWADNGSCTLEITGPEKLPHCTHVDMDLYAYDFASKEETRLANHVGARWHPDLHVHGSHVVWEQSRANGKSEIRLLDLDSGQEQMVSLVSQTNTRPQIYGDYLFWTERVTCDAIDLGNLRARTQAGAFVYDLETGRKMRISSDVEPLVRIYGHIAFLTEGCQYQTRLFAIFLQS